MREQAGGFALIRPLIEVRRREVVEVGGREIAHHAVVADGEVARGIEVVEVVLVVGQEPSARRVAGAAAGERVGRRIACVGRAERAGAEVAPVLRDRIERAIADIDRCIAASVRRVDAGDEREVLGVAITHVALRQPEAVVAHDVRDVVGVVVVLVHAVLSIEPHAFELVVHDEVDDARDGIGAVYGGRAARQHFDALDQRGRYLIQVRRSGAVLRRIARHQPAAVDQHQRALRAEIAQIDSRRTGRAVGQVAAEVGERLRQVVDQVFDAGHALDLHLIGAHGRHRADAREIGLGNARAGHDHFLDGRAFLRLCRQRASERGSCASEQRAANRALNGQIRRH